MIVCPSCGTENAESAKFCAECGTRLKPVEPPSPALQPTDAARTGQVTEPATSLAGDAAPVQETPVQEPPSAPSSGKDASGLPPAWMPPPVTLQSRPSGQLYQPPAEPVAPAEPSNARSSDEAPLPGKDATGLPPAWMPPPVTPAFQGGGSGGDGDWKMSDLGPVPERRNRRLWLWIPVGLMSFVLICCVAVFIWSATIGEDTINRWATEAAVERTEEALSGE